MQSLLSLAIPEETGFFVFTFISLIFQICLNSLISKFTFFCTDGEHAGTKQQATTQHFVKRIVGTWFILLPLC